MAADEEEEEARSERVEGNCTEKHRVTSSRAFCHDLERVDREKENETRSSHLLCVIGLLA